MTIEELTAALIAEYGDHYRVTVNAEMRQPAIGAAPATEWRAYLWTARGSECAASAYANNPHDIAAILRANRDKRKFEARERLAEIGG